MSDFTPPPSRDAFVVGRLSVFLEVLPLHSRAPLLRAPASPCIRVGVSGHTRLPVACVFCAQGPLSPWTRGWHRESRAPAPMPPRGPHTRGCPLASKPCAQRGTRVAILRARLPALRGASTTHCAPHRHRRGHVCHVGVLPPCCPPAPGYSGQSARGFVTLSR